MAVKKKKAFCTMFKRSDTEKAVYEMAKSYKEMQEKIASLESEVKTLKGEETTTKKTRKKSTEE